MRQPVQGTLPGEMHGRECGWQWAQTRGWARPRMTAPSLDDRPAPMGTLCHLPCARQLQSFFTEQLGMPLTMKPNFEDYSCEVGSRCRVRLPCAVWPAWRSWRSRLHCCHSNSRGGSPPPGSPTVAAVLAYEAPCSRSALLLVDGVWGAPTAAGGRPSLSAVLPGSLCHRHHGGRQAVPQAGVSWRDWGACTSCVAGAWINTDERSSVTLCSGSGLLYY